jgi:hypothetical protein
MRVMLSRDLLSGPIPGVFEGSPKSSSPEKPKTYFDESKGEKEQHTAEVVAATCRVL